MTTSKVSFPIKAHIKRAKDSQQRKINTDKFRRKPKKDYRKKHHINKDEDKVLRRPPNTKKMIIIRSRAKRRDQRTRNPEGQWRANEPNCEVKTSLSHHLNILNRCIPNNENSGIPREFCYQIGE